MDSLYFTHHIVDLALAKNETAVIQLADLDRMYETMANQKMQPNTILLSPGTYTEMIAFNKDEQVELCPKFEPHITSMMLS